MSPRERMERERGYGPPRARGFGPPREPGYGPPMGMGPEGPMMGPDGPMGPEDWAAPSPPRSPFARITSRQKDPGNHEVGLMSRSIPYGDGAAPQVADQAASRDGSPTGQRQSLHNRATRRDPSGRGGGAPPSRAEEEAKRQWMAKQEGQGWGQPRSGNFPPGFEPGMPPREPAPVGLMSRPVMPGREANRQPGVPPRQQRPPPEAREPLAREQHRRSADRPGPTGWGGRQPEPLAARLDREREERMRVMGREAIGGPPYGPPMVEDERMMPERMALPYGPPMPDDEPIERMALPYGPPMADDERERMEMEHERMERFRPPPIDVQLEEERNYERMRMDREAFRNDPRLGRVPRGRRNAARRGDVDDVPVWVQRASELLQKNKVNVRMVALQVRREAAMGDEPVDARGFDYLLEMQGELGLNADRVLELQDELRV